MSKIPHFAGVQQLSLTDLQALADAVEAQTRILPAAGLPGRVGSRKYSLANFNLDTANSCDGSAWPENEGLIRSVGYSEEDEPYICQGDIALPMAHYVPGAGDESPAATGVLHSVLVEGGIAAPDIQRGQMRLPLADSACDGAVAGLVRGVEVDADATSPYIEQGVLHLTESACGGTCSCVPAEYTPGGDECSGSVLGLIRSIDPNNSILQPDIVDGAVRLPYADTARGAVGIMQGVEVVEGFRDPLICYGYLFLPLADTCNGATGLINGVAVDATEPYISAGVLHLPLACGGTCSCVPAEYDGSSSTLGLVRSIDPASGIAAADIVDGAIRIPYADSDYCDGTCGLVSGIEVDSTLTEPKITQGVIKLPLTGVNGLRDSYGNGIPWASVNGTLLSTHYVGSYKYDLTATYDSGFLCLQIIQDYGES